MTKALKFENKKMKTENTKKSSFKIRIQIIVYKYF